MNFDLITQMASDPRAFRDHLMLPGAHGAVPCGPSLADFQRDWFTALDPALLAVRAGLQPPIGRYWVEATKGAGKDTMLAVAFLWLLAFTNRMLTCQVAAVDTDQADELRKCAKAILRENEWLAELIVVQNGRIIGKHNESVVEIIAADTAGSHGARPDVLVVNELAHIAKTEFVENLLDNAAKVPRGLVVIATNAGFRQSWAWTMREACRQSDRWYFSAYTLPAPWISPAELEERRRVSSAVRFARLWQGVWGSASGDAFDDADLQAAVTQEHRMNGSEPGYRFCAGVDLGIKHDHSAVCILGAHYDTQRVRVANTWDFAPGQDGKVSLEFVQQKILAAHRQYKPEVWRFDPWQCELLAEQLRRHGLKLEPVNFSGGQLGVMATTAMEVIRGRKLDTYNDQRLLTDLRRMTITEKSYGHRLESTRDSQGHCDVGTSFLIALPKAVEMAGKRRRTIAVG